MTLIGWLFSAARRSWHALPLNERARASLRKALFTRLPRLFRVTKSYSMWQLRENNIKALRPLRQGRRCLVLSTGHTLFIAEQLSRELASFGFQPTIQESWAGGETDFCFAIAPHMFEHLPAHYFVVQVEQLQDQRWRSESYNGLLRASAAVLDYSADNIAELLSRGFHYTGLFHLPISIAERVNRQMDRPIEILFYGAMNERRRAIISALSDEWTITIASEVFGEEMKSRLSSTKIVLNLHFYDDARLETTRLCESLSHGAMVLSEDATDISAHPELVNLVTFVSTGNIEAMRRALRTLKDRADVQQSLSEHHSAIAAAPRHFRGYLARFLLAQQMISFETFESSVPAYPGLPESWSRICLTLPETPDRRQAFSTAHPQFALFDGLRYHPAWKGCALSYKHLFNATAARQSDMMVICEDDAVFDQADPRLDAILQYLAARVGQWDVFSGFIADLSEDVRIIRIEEEQGQKYIWLDHAVSTLFNIYAPSARQGLSNWNIRDDLTIDRYMASLGLRFVTTYPFFAGHDETLTSTVWGFDNREYRTMIEKTNVTLSRKIREFEHAEANAGANG
ncbi:MAG: hypothetical protein NXI27_21075 [Alphaproteobacteria bacterium]|nr:hypothetical protein [Alphaproteobacteria bacterium]